MTGSNSFAIGSLVQRFVEEKPRLSVLEQEMSVTDNVQ
jgi:hypothetical protein